MKVVLILSVCWLVGVTAAAPVGAQEPGPAAASREAMKKMEFLAGEWKGEGWMIRGPEGRQEFVIHEKVQPKLGGLLYVIDGVGRPKDDPEKIVHEAFAVVNFDARTKTHRFRAFTAQGYSSEGDARIGDKTLQWGFDTPGGGKVRYTLKLTEQGEWNEIGEFSQDGKTWRKFLEMTLRRVSDKQKD